MKDLFTIGELSKLYGISDKTLRYYEHAGLIKPEEINPETKYRYYSTKQFEVLNCILSLRTLDVPVSQIKKFLEHRTTEDIQKILSEQKNQIEQKQKQLEQYEQRITSRIKYLENTIHSELNCIHECFFPKREIVMNEKEITLQEDIEFSLREIGGKNPHDFPVFLGKVGYIISVESLRTYQTGTYKGIFIFLEKGDSCGGIRKTIPEGNYLTIRFNGTHFDARNYYKQLLKYIEKNNYKLNGDALEIALMDQCLTDDYTQYVVEIQVPFKKV